MTRAIRWVGVAIIAAAPVANATPVNGTGFLTSDVIFGSGNADGGFTGVTAGNLELALRAKQRYPAANTFNYDNDHTYTFDSSVLNTNPANRSVFNFEWSINTDVNDGTDMPSSTIDAYTYLLQIDQDPTVGVDFTGAEFDPYGVGPLDHAFGYNSTANGGGVSDASDPAFTNNAATYNVSQQSWNLGFGFSGDPDLPGSYVITLSAFDSMGSSPIASTSITVNVEPIPASEPATLSLIFGGMALGMMGLRRRKQSPVAAA